MAYEMMVGIQVKDDIMYSKYRKAMCPILKKYSGGFRYDFKVSETLKSESKKPINRVFAIYFLDKLSMDQFFSNEAYKKVKEQYFENSVGATTIISEYIRNEF